jgi:hypothetical protein
MISSGQIFATFLQVGNYFANFRAVLAVSNINLAALVIWDSTFGKMGYHNWQLQYHILK